MMDKKLLKVYLVGGYVRDKLVNVLSNDKDWLLINMTESNMLDNYFHKVGKDFPVFLHPISKDEYSLARREKKIGKVHNSFSCNTDNVTLYDDLSRRDLTINAIALDEIGLVYDPFGGVKDLQDKLLKHINRSFIEDPLRILRVARFAAKFAHLGFKISSNTLDIMRCMVNNFELASISGERFCYEIAKALLTQNPQIFFITLRTINTFDHVMKPILSIFDGFYDIFRIVNHAKSNGYSVSKVLFILTFFRLSKLKIVKLSKELRFSTILTKLILNVHIYHNVLIHFKDCTSFDIFNMFVKTNALRDISSFKIVLYCSFNIHCIHISFKNLNNHALIKTLNYLKSYNYKTVVTAIKNKNAIPNIMKNLKISLIAKFLHIA